MRPRSFRKALVLGLAILTSTFAPIEAWGQDKTIVEIASGNEDFSKLVLALKAAGLADALGGKGPFTVFAPKDAAFDALGEETLTALFRDKKKLTEVLKYHVVAGKVPAAAAIALGNRGGFAKTLNGETLKFSIKDGSLFLNEDVKVIATDVIGKNGVIHVVDKVLVPWPSIVEIASGNKDFSKLVLALKIAGLVEPLGGKGPFTVFAPKNSAFDALGEEPFTALLGDRKKLTEFLKYHVVAGKVFASSAVALGERGGSAKTLNGDAIKFSVKDGSLFLNGDVKVIATDVIGRNGVIHVIDKALVPPPTLGEIAAGDKNFSKLVLALKVADLFAAVNPDSIQPPITVFAPTNSAFDALGEEALTSLLGDKKKLSEVLTYHVVPGKIPASTAISLAERGGSARALNGEAINLSIKDGSLFLNGNVRVVKTDVVGRNGVIHVIDKVLSPPPTIVEIAAGNKDFSKLTLALKTAGLVDALSGAGPFTVFAPTDAAFDALGEKTLMAVLGDKKKLTEILNYHVVFGKVPAASAVALAQRGGIARTLNGEAIKLSIKDGSLFLNGDVKVIKTDVVGRNGVIHVIDKVLAPPPTIVEIAAGNKDFSKLVLALKTAGLVDSLSGAGPFTVFAPTDAAFDALGEETLKVVLGDKKKLTEILTYHVVPGKVLAASAVALGQRNGSAQTLNGTAIDLSIKEGNLFLNENVKVIATDVVGRNGVIHVIDKVLLPPPTIVDLAAGSKDFSKLVLALKTAGLVDVLNGAGPFTVFAPTNAAFEALGEETLKAVLSDKKKLAEILKYHVVSGKVSGLAAIDLADRGESAKSLNGEEIQLSIKEGRLVLNGNAKVISTDVNGKNGIIHVIDKVLLPRAVALPAAPGKMSAIDTIERSVERGVALYNAGLHRECAEVYLETVRELLRTHSNQMPFGVRNRLQQAADSANPHSQPRETAWQLRHDLDAAYEQMQLTRSTAR